MSAPLSLILGLLVGLAAGGLVGWLVAGSRAQARAAAAEAALTELRQQTTKGEEELSSLRSQLTEEQKARITAETALQGEKEKLAEVRKDFEQAREKLSDAFKALAAEVMKDQSGAFLTLARQTFERLRAEAEGDLGKRQEAIQGLLEPLKQTLSGLEGEVRAMEEKRQKAYGGLEEQLRALASSSQELQRQAGNLATALKGMPQVRGKWGELALRRVVELAGMVEHVDFVEQQSTATEEGRLRPDMIIHSAVGSMEARVMPAARKFRELGAAPGEEIPQLEPVDQIPRTLSLPEGPEPE